MQVRPTTSLTGNYQGNAHTLFAASFRCESTPDYRFGKGISLMPQQRSGRFCSDRQPFNKRPETTRPGQKMAIESIQKNTREGQVSPIIPKKRRTFVYY